MLIQKTLHAAGIAALLVASSARAALSADMMQQGVAPPPMPPSMPSATAIAGDSGFYLRGDIGTGRHDYSSITTLPPINGLRTINSSVDSAVFAGIGAGYQFNSYLRGDITGEYRARARHHHVDTFTGSTGPGANLDTGSVGGYVALANAYVDLGTWYRVTPFIGAGIGMASMTMGKTTDTGFNVASGSSGVAPAKTNTRLAWALHAGASFDLGNNWRAEGAYRYLNIGKLNGGSVVCTPACPGYYHVQIKNLVSHDLRFGLRYLFADSTMAPGYGTYGTYGTYYGQGPLVRKY